MFRLLFLLLNSLLYLSKEGDGAPTITAIGEEDREQPQSLSDMFMDENVDTNIMKGLSSGNDAWPTTEHGGKEIRDVTDAKITTENGENTKTNLSNNVLQPRKLSKASGLADQNSKKSLWKSLTKKANYVKLDIAKFAERAKRRASAPKSRSSDYIRSSGGEMVQEGWKRKSANDGGRLIKKRKIETVETLDKPQETEEIEEIPRASPPPVLAKEGALNLADIAAAVFLHGPPELQNDPEVAKLSGIAVEKYADAYKDRGVDMEPAPPGILNPRTQALSNMTALMLQEYDRERGKPPAMFTRPFVPRRRQSNLEDFEIIN